MSLREASPREVQMCCAECDWPLLWMHGHLTVPELSPCRRTRSGAPRGACACSCVVAQMGMRRPGDGDLVTSEMLGL